jgi:hypothetical protein
MQAKELIKDEPEKPKLAILTRIIKRRSKASKLNLVAAVRCVKVCHVAEITYRSVRVPRVSPASFVRLWEEVENLAEFDGPTAEDAANSYCDLLKKCTSIDPDAPRAKCNGPKAKITLWRETIKNPQSTTCRIVAA